MIKMQALKTFRGRHGEGVDGLVRRNRPFIVADPRRADDLVRAGMAVIDAITARVDEVQPIGPGPETDPVPAAPSADVEQASRGKRRRERGARQTETSGEPGQFSGFEE